MEELLIEAILKAVDIAKAADEIKNDLVLKNLDEIQRKLDLLLQKSDQLILREIKSAYEALGDALTTINEETKEVRLKYAEESLLKNTNLDGAIETGGIPNSYLMALSHYGLSIVCALRGDLQIAARHLLRVFIVDPWRARNVIVPKLYEKLFKPKCADVFEWYEEEKKAVEREYGANKDVSSLESGLTRLGAYVTYAGGAVGAVAMKNPGIFRAAQDTYGNLIKHAEGRENYKIAKEHARQAFFSKLDTRCREIAADLLSDFNEPPAR